MNSIDEYEDLLRLFVSTTYYGSFDPILIETLNYLNDSSSEYVPDDVKRYFIGKIDKR